MRSGQRVIFLSLDDGTGVGDATFFESVHERCAWTVFHTWLLVVEGVVHRTGRRGVSLTADRAWDLRRLMVAWQEGWLDEALREDLRPSPGGAPTPSRPGRPRALGTDLDPRATDFTDGAPSEAIRGAPGRSGLVLRDGEHLQLARPVPYRGGARDADQPAEADTWAARDPRRVARSPAARLPVPRNAPHGPGRPPWEHVPPGRRGDPAGPPRRPGPIGGEPPRKLWHSSGGSAGA